EPECCRRDVEKDEVGDRTMEHAVDGIAGSPSDDQAKRCGGQPRGRPREPDQQQEHCRDLDREQHPLPQWSILLEQAIADALVPGHNQVEKRREPHRRAGGQVKDVKEPELRGLVEGGAYDCHKQAKTRQRSHHGLQPTLTYTAALLRAAFHSRSALASRGVTSGKPGSEPTLGRIFHERSQRLPSARRTSTATPATSSSRKAPGGPSVSTRVAAEVIETSARSTSTTASNSAGLLTWIIGSASSGAPMRLAARSISSAPVTTRRTMRTLRHFSASASSRPAAGISGNCSRCTEASGDG